MHKLDREGVSKPQCLNNYDFSTQDWSQLTGAHKKLVRLSLQKMQGRQLVTDDADDEAEYILGLCCAYCEAQIFHGGHIEHFRRKHDGHYPELTFDWDNLFIACKSTAHCGHYKDHRGAVYNADELIKPDVHDPDDYLYFHSSGEVRVRNRVNMTEADRRRGSETVRVFNLDCGFLQGARRRALTTYLSKNIGIMEDLMEFDADDRKVFIEEEIQATRFEPFWTTIRHFFEKMHA